MKELLIFLSKIVVDLPQIFTYIFTLGATLFFTKKWINSTDSNIKILNGSMGSISTSLLLTEYRLTENKNSIDKLSSKFDSQRKDSEQLNRIESKINKISNPDHTIYSNAS